MTTVFSKRVIAYVLDFFVVSAVMWIVSYFLFALLGSNNVHAVYQFIPYVVPVLILLYFILFEKTMGATVGKALMSIRVISKNGAAISWPQAIVRNLTKIYWFPIIFDWIIGKFMRTDRLFNNITRTIVISED